jgi:2,4-diketo-3-deoxy-L-fuconate hydrolase
VYLMRLGPAGAEQPVVGLSDDTYLDVADLVSDYDAAFFASGGVAALRTVVAERSAAGAAQWLAGQRIGAPIARPHQIVCVGLNYRDHAEESGMAIPTEPIVFTKPPNTIIGPDDDVHIPRGSTKTDWEVELGVVIGARCRYLPDRTAALAAVAGYTIVNDVSEREFQLERGGTWFKGKAAETFTPCGPYLVTPDEIPAVQDLPMWLDVNGVRRQTGNTATMLFDVAHVVHYLSQFMVLEPGDLVLTGTPPGVGMGATPQTYLRPGDVMELAIEGLGRQRQDVVAAP